MPNVQIFLSTVTAEFQSYRDRLQQSLDRPNVAIKVQEKFIATGTETLDMLDLYIKDCDAVVHLVGDMTGAMAQAPSIEVIRQRYPDFDKRFPVLTEFLKPDGPLLPYTQWEAWLALYHKKPLIICVPEQGATRDERYRDDEAERAAQQAHLTRLETIERYPGIRFTDSVQLALEVMRSSLLEILNSASAVQSAGARMIDFAQELMRHGEIIGREKEIATIRGWIAGASSGWILIKGNPGTGKSAIMAAVLNELENDYGPEAVPFHFLRRRQGDWGEPDTVVSNLIARLEQINTSPERLTSQGLDRLFALLKTVGQQYASLNRRLVVIVDGLDEASVADGAQGILGRFLPATVPDNVFILCASRPNYPELGWVEERLGLFPPIDLDGPPWVDNNRVVVAAYWNKLGPQLNPPLDEDLIQSAIAAAEGNMLHAVTLCEAFKANTQVRDPKRIPVQFNRLLEDLWRSLVQMKDRDISGRVIAGLGLLTVAYEALPLSTLAHLLEWWHPADIEDFKLYARPFLLEESAEWHGGEARYRPFHESIREFLTGGNHMLPHVKRQYHKLLAEQLASWPPSGDAGQLERGYAARFALVHLSTIGNWSRVSELLGDLAYCVAAVETVGPQLLLARITAFDTEGKPPKFVERANALRRVLRMESQVLENYPRELPNLIHNHLTCLGWTSERIRAAFSGFNRGWGLINAIDIGDEICTLRGHTASVKSCDLDSQGRYGVSGGLDGDVRIWDLARGTSLHVMRSPPNATRCDIDSCAISSDGRYVIAALSIIEWDRPQGYGRIRIWRTRDGTLIVDAEHDAPQSTRVAFAGNEKAIACHKAGYIDVYDIARATSERLVLGEEMDPRVSVNASGTLLAGTTARGCVVWKLNDGSIVSSVTLPMFGDRKYRHAPICSFGPDETSVAVVAYNRALIFNSADGSAQYRSYRVGQPADCRLLDSKRLLITLDSTCELVVWDMESNQAVATYEGHTYSANCCAATPDGRLALTGGGDNTVRLWSIVDQVGAVHVDRHAKLVYDCAVNASATLACSVPADEPPTMWNARTGARLLPINTFQRYRSARFCRFEGNSRLAMLDPKLRLYNPETGQLECEKDIPLRNKLGTISWIDDGVTEGSPVSNNRLDQLPSIYAGGDMLVWGPSGEFQSIQLLNDTIDTGLSGRLAGRYGRTVSRLNNERSIAWLNKEVVEIINPNDGSRKTIAKGVITCVGSPRNNALYALMADQRLVRLDATSGKVLDVLGEIPQENVNLLIDGQETSLWALCWDHAFGFNAKTNQVLMAFSPQTSRLVHQTSISGHDVTDLCFLSGMLITAGWSDATLRVWDAHQPMPLAVIPGSSPFRCVAAAGDRIVAGDQKGNIWFLARMQDLYP